MSTEPITAEWLASVGFKWHELDRQPDKHWLLWLGEALHEPRRAWSSSEDLGIELAPTRSDGEWYCWLRADVSHRYSRFLHVRHLVTQAELIRLIEGLTGKPWDPADNLYGSMRTAAQAARIRAEDNRLDRVIARDNPKWYEHENDDTRGGPMWEDLDALDKCRKQIREGGASKEEGKKR